MEDVKRKALAKAKFIALREERARVNPYRTKVLQYPGSIFCFEEHEREEISKIRAMLDTGKPVIVELGSGSGEHLIERARLAPTALCFGFEIRFKRAVRTIEKSEKILNVQNAERRLFVLRADYRSIGEIFPAGSIDCLYVNFPDPWEKKAQRKHRVLSMWLLDQKLLRVNGILSVKTDHAEYFSEFRELLQNDKRYSIVASTEDLAASEWEHRNVPTEFEKLFRSQKLPINYIEARFTNSLF